MIVPSPLLTKIGLSAALYLGLFGVGYWQGYEHRDRSAAEEMAKVNAVAAATNARYRSLEQEVERAQSAYVASLTAARNVDRAERLRISKAVARGVSAVPSECPSVAADQGPELERLDPALTAGDAADAFNAGAELEATLTLCQQELRQCAGLR